MNKIDMRCIAGQQILCEFWDEGMDPDVEIVKIGFLAEYQHLSPCKYIDDDSGKRFFGCRIKRNIWMANPRRDLVLPNGLMIGFMVHYLSPEGFSQEGTGVTWSGPNGVMVSIDGNNGSIPLSSFTEGVRVLRAAEGWKW